jgi:hypothetical protein
MSSTRTMGQVGAIAIALGTGMGVTSVPATAAPAESGAKMYYYRDSVYAEQTQVQIEGVLAMSEADAVGFLNNIYTGKEPGGMEYRIFGDDNGEGDRSQVYRWVAGNGSFPGYQLNATPNGIHHTFTFYLPTNLLNEDDNFSDNDDEIYAQATFVDADGGRRTQTSNVIYDRF